MFSVAGRAHRSGEDEQGVGEHHPVGGVVRDLVLLAGALGTTVLVFARAILAEYGRNDDYGFIYQKHVGLLEKPTAIWDGTGRPVAGQLVRVLLGPVDSVEELRWMRLMCVVCLGLGVWLVAVLVCRLTSGPGGWAAPVVGLCVGAVSLVTPGATSAATWAIMAGQLFALPSALAAGMWVMLHRGRTWATVLGTVLLVAASVFSYQHFAVVAMFPALVIAAVRWARHEQAGILRVVGLGVCVVTMLVANVLYVRAGDTYGMSRFPDVPVRDRVDWWSGEFLPRTVDLALPWSWATVGGSALFLCLLLALPLTLGRRFAALPLAVLLAWLAAALVVVPGELWASARLVSAAQLVIWTGAALCAGYAVLEWPPGRSGSAAWRIAGIGSLVVLTVAGCLLSAHRAWVYFAEPSSADWRAAVCTMRTQPPLEAGVKVGLSPFLRSSAPFVEYDDFGIIASSIPWALQYEVWLAELRTSGEPAVDNKEIVPVPAAPFDFEIKSGACGAGTS